MARTTRTPAAGLVDATVGRFYLDHPRIGCGFRNLLIVKRGRKWVTLLEPASLRHVKVAVGEFEKAYQQDQSKLLKKYQQRVRRARKLQDNLGLKYSKATVKDALKLKKAGTS